MNKRSTNKYNITFVQQNTSDAMLNLVSSNRLKCRIIAAERKQGNRDYKYYKSTVLIFWFVYLLLFSLQKQNLVFFINKRIICMTYVQ